MIEFKNNFRIEYAKGDTYALKITFKNVTQDLTTAIFSVKENADDTTALIEKTIGNGISKVDDNYYKQQSVYKLQLQAEDSQNLQPDNLYLYDLKVAVGNVIKTVISGNFVVRYNVTSVDRIETSLANIEVDEVIETDIETTPATSGIEYEQDPIAMAKIGDITNLNTTAKNNLVSAINEVNTKATASAEEITKIENGTVSVPEATHSTSADNATTADSATNSTNVQNVDFSADTSAVFGNYIVSKKKLVWSDDNGLDVHSGNATLVSNFTPKNNTCYEFLFNLEYGSHNSSYILNCYVDKKAVEIGLEIFAYWGISTIVRQIIPYTSNNNTDTATSIETEYVTLNVNSQNDFYIKNFTKTLNLSDFSIDTGVGTLALSKIYEIIQ